jgi:(2R)-ethylmalonyl-CoA mutase
LVVDPATEAAQIAGLDRWRAQRDSDAVTKALDRLRQAAAGPENLFPATIELARASGTVGEWASALREVFGEYRAPTGVGAASGAGSAHARERLTAVRERVKAAAGNGGPPKILVGKPGLDGHSNGAEQIAVAARDAGFEVVYQGIRLTPEQIAAAARDEDVDLVGLSILSGSHLELVPETIRLLREAGVTAPVVVGGIIPERDQRALSEAGVARVYTPKDFELSKIVEEMADLALEERSNRPRRGPMETT